MHNNKILKIITMAIILLMINGILALVINQYTATRIINQIFLNIAIIAFAVSPFIENNTRDEEYLNYYKIPVFGVYLIITSIISIVLMILNAKNILITIVPQFLVTGIFIVTILTLKMSDNHTINSDNEIKDRRMPVKEFENRLKIIMTDTSSREIYKKIEKVYDNARSLKINIKSNSSELDNEILSEIILLEKNVISKNIEEIDKIINEINTNFVKRNSM